MKYGIALLPIALLLGMSFRNPVLTEAEKAVITDEFLLSRTISVSQAKNCDAYIRSMQLMMARSVIRNLYAANIKTPHREDIVKSLGYNLGLYQCGTVPGTVIPATNADPATQRLVPVIIRKGPGGVTTGKVLPLDVYLMSILTDEQRQLIFESLTDESAKELKEFEKGNKALLSNFEKGLDEKIKWDIKQNDKSYNFPKDKAEWQPIELNKLTSKMYTDSIRKTNRIDDF